MVSKLIQKDVNIADFGIEAITDSGRVQLSENKKGALSVDTYNKMIDPESEEYQMSEEPQAEYEIFYSEDGVKKVRTAGGNVYPHGTPEYTKVTGESSTNGGLQIAMRPLPALSIMRIEFPEIIINELNEHIDNEIISKSKSRADGLVGQLKNSNKSAQLDFPFDTEVGEQIQTVFNQIGTTYLNQLNRDANAQVTQCWTNHAYAGDYNPFHDHGVQTIAGLSGFLWLKVPQCIKDTPDVHEIKNASGGVDGWTHLCWGVNTMRDLMQLRPQTEDYVKPTEGCMLVFPQWLKHQVMPFFGEGERRSIAMNWNVHDSEDERKKYMSDREASLYDEQKAKEES
jgi:hypothetical protein